MTTLSLKKKKKRLIGFVKENRLVNFYLACVEFFFFFKPRSKCMPISGMLVLNLQIFKITHYIKRVAMSHPFFLKLTSIKKGSN
jgi:hypothetical protein